MPLPLPNSPPTLEHCPYCDARLNFTQRSHPGHCGAWDCTRAHAAFAAKRSKAAWRKTHAEKAKVAGAQKADEIAGLIAGHDLDPDRIHLGTVPHMDRPLIPLPQTRKDAHLTHLRQIIDDAFARAHGAPSTERRDMQAEAAETAPWNATACGVCRGECCRDAGETFAYQTADTIHDLRYNKPEMSAADIYAYFENALPDTSVKDACVYQGDMGCVLPRDMRADICNTYHCYALRRMAEDVERSTTDAVVVVSMVPGKAGRVALYPLKEGDKP